MAKSFAPRVSKKDRKTFDYVGKVDLSKIEASDNKLLAGAKIQEIQLKDIVVKEQVRTKFNDKSIKELAANIEVNGLIQPLVVHRVGGKYTLICGERRFRAMGLLPLEKASCFVLENKTEEELMAIQFSENSAREELHWIDKADGILNYHEATGASERKIVAALGISKTEVHRSLLIARLPKDIKEAAKTYNIEKYVLLEWEALEEADLKAKLYGEIIQGHVVKRTDLKKVSLAFGGGLPANKTLSAQAFLRALDSSVKGRGLDANTEKLLKNLVEETREMIDL